MLGKLLKYDFRSMWKQFAIVWPAALVLALINGIMFRTNIGDASQLSETLMVILMVVYVAVMIAMFVVSLLFIIQRFYKGLLGDEGYLMHTLPVKPWQLITSKLICAVVVTVISILVAMASILLMIPLTFSDFREFFISLANSFDVQSAIFLLELILAILVGMAQSYLQLYLAMAIGHLFSKNRIAASVIAYIAINAALSTILGILGITGASIVQPLFEFFNSTLSGFSAMAALHTMMWSAVIGSALLGALFFLAANYILSRRLNLE